MKNKNKLILIAIIGFGIIIRIFFWLKINNNFYNWDESYHGLSGLVLYKFILSGFNLDYLQTMISHYWSAIYSLFFYPYGYSFLTVISLSIVGTNMLAIRLPAMLFSVLIILATYLLGRELFGKKVGLISAFLSAINPYFIIIGGVALVDIPMTYFMIMSLYFILKSFKTDQNKYYLLSGLAIGLAGFMKPPGFIILIPILFLIFSYKKLNFLYFKKTLILLGGMSIFWIIYFGSGLLIYFLIDNIAIKNTILNYIFHWFLGSKSLPSSNNISWLSLEGWLYYLKFIPSQIGGYVMTSLTFFGTFILLKKGNRQLNLVVLVYILFIYLTFVFILKKDPRFTVPYLPMLIILAALTIEKIFEIIKNKKILILISLILIIPILIETITITNKRLPGINYYNLIPAVQSILDDNIHNLETIIATNRDDQINNTLIPDISLLVLLQDPNLIYSVYYQDQAGQKDYFITDHQIINYDQWRLINQSNNGIIIYTYKSNK